MADIKGGCDDKQGRRKCGGKGRKAEARAEARVEARMEARGEARAMDGKTVAGANGIVEAG
jgi:hypothetical protein